MVNSGDKKEVRDYGAPRRHTQVGGRLGSQGHKENSDNEEEEVLCTPAETDRRIENGSKE